MSIKIISWNVNGIRSVLTKGFYDFVKKEDPDILCVQEIKAHPSDVDVKLALYEHHYWNSAEKKGYAGTAVFSKIKPLTVSYANNTVNHNVEGRITTLEFEKFILVNVYTPNSQRGLTRLEYRQEWDRHFLSYLKELEQKKPVIFCGDLNVAHTEIDLARPKDNVRNAGFTIEERNGFDRFVSAGFVDSFRLLHPTEIKYSWWSYMFNARAKNIGWRIDYVCLSPSLKWDLKEAFILDEVKGSDHCPVGIVLK
jgi:exodeoxyribonuclease-3